MTDENKDIENNKEENHNIPEYNKNLCKFVGGQINKTQPTDLVFISQF